MITTTNTRTRTNANTLHIRIFIVNNLEKWLEQNKAECIECVEGCLIDNALYACKRGYAAIYERFVNTWSSAYEIHFQPYSNNDGMDVCNAFYKRFEDELRDLDN
jgi:hypothetical protein